MCELSLSKAIRIYAQNGRGGVGLLRSQLLLFLVLFRRLGLSQLRRLGA